MDVIKRFFKELKRVRWNKISDTNKWFIKIIIFTTIAALILFGISIGLSSLWSEIGVGLNA